MRLEQFWKISRSETEYKQSPKFGLWPITWGISILTALSARPIFKSTTPAHTHFQNDKNTKYILDFCGDCHMHRKENRNIAMCHYAGAEVFDVKKQQTLVSDQSVVVVVLTKAIWFENTFCNLYPHKTTLGHFS